jgi:hypothetical protein
MARCMDHAFCVRTKAGTVRPPGGWAGAGVSDRRCGALVAQENGMAGDYLVQNAAGDQASAARRPPAWGWGVDSAPAQWVIEAATFTGLYELAT